MRNQPSRLSFLSLSACALAGAVAAGGCKPTPLPGEPNSPLTYDPTVEEGEAEGPDPALLQIADHTFTIGEFEARAARLSPLAQYKLNTPQTRGELLELFVWAELLSLHATREGAVGGAEEVLFGAEVETLANLEDHVERTLDQEAIHAQNGAWFDAHRDIFQRPERRRIYGIVTDSAETAAVAHAEVTRALEHSEPRHVFALFAPLYSTDEATAADGTMGWLVREEDGGTADPAVIAAAFALEAGELSEVFPSTRGWEFVFLAQVEEEMDLPFDRVDGYVAERAMQEARGAAMRDRLDAARRDAGASIDQAAVATLVAARVGGDSPSERPRRYSLETLQQLPSAELGDDVTAAVEADAAAIIDNPLLRPQDPPVNTPAPDGSGAEAPQGPDSL